LSSTDRGLQDSMRARVSRESQKRSNITERHVRHGLTTSVTWRSPFMQRHGGEPEMTMRSPPLDERRVPDHGWSDHLAQIGPEKEPQLLERSFSFG